MSNPLQYAFEAGYHARLAGRPISSCPVFCNGPLGEPERLEWRRGWNEAGKHGKA